MPRDPALDALLDLDGQVYVLDPDARHSVRFRVNRVAPTPERPHGLHYSLTLHDEAGARLVGFDNAHPVRARPGRAEPKVWFASIESLAKVLSDRNRALLALIAETAPGSLAELAARSGRAKSNLSRTLRTMARYGLVHLDEGEGGRIVPRVPYTDIVLDVRIGARGERADRAA